MGCAAMSKLGEVRQTQEVQLERLRKLQLDKLVAPPDRKEIIQTEIQTVMKAIEKLDTEIQQLIKEGRTPRAAP
jgi:hypothetical protein